MATFRTLSSKVLYKVFAAHSLTDELPQRVLVVWGSVPKDTLACGQEELGIKLQEMEENPLYLLSRSSPILGFS